MTGLTATTRTSSRGPLIATRATAAVGAALAVTGSVSLVVEGHGREALTNSYFVFALFATFFAGVAWVVIPRQPRNTVVWIMAGSAFSAGVYIAGTAWAAALATDPLLVLIRSEHVVPSRLTRSVASIMRGTQPAIIPALFTPLTFGLLLFPDGKLPTRRWRWLGWVAGAGIAMSTISLWFGFRSDNTEPADTGFLSDAGLAVLLLAAVLSLAALVGRFRRSTGTARQQFKWVVWGAGSFGCASVLGALISETSLEDLAIIAFSFATIVFLASYGIAITKYRLFDVEIVINRTVMVAVLSLIVTALYVAVVVGVGSLAGGGTEIWVQVAATVVVALAFGPVRRRAQQWANRLVYGKRATPYEILARFSHRAAETSDADLLTRIPRLIVDGTGAVEATLWVRSDGGFRVAAAWPATTERSEIPPADSFQDPDADYSVPVIHDGELLGGLSLVNSRGETLPRAAEQLVANLASGMGLALRNASLTSRLRDQVIELVASRERILAAADEARRSLERDLDSGPQQQLVAVKVMLGPTRKQAAQAGAAKTADVLAQLESDAGDAIQAVREFSGGVYPPLLEAEGLATTLAEQVPKSTLPIKLHANGIGRYPRETEAAAYFTILEALQNIAKYAKASSVSVVLQESDGELRFEISDDGIGFDPATVTAGSGLANMADRLDAAGGRLTLDSSPGAGTTVRGSVPLGRGA